MLPSRRIIGRPLKLLFPLETSKSMNISYLKSNDNLTSEESTKKFDEAQTTSNSALKSERQAAKIAKHKIKQISQN